MLFWFIVKFLIVCLLISVVLLVISDRFESKLLVIIGSIIFNLKFLDCLFMVIVVLLFIICVEVIVIVFGMIGFILLGIIDEFGCSVGSVILFKLVKGLEFI